MTLGSDGSRGRGMVQRDGEERPARQAAVRRRELRRLVGGGSCEQREGREPGE